MAEKSWLTSWAAPIGKPRSRPANFRLTPTMGWRSGASSASRAIIPGRWRCAGSASASYRDLRCVGARRRCRQLIFAAIGLALMGHLGRPGAHVLALDEVVRIGIDELQHGAAARAVRR